MKKLTLLQNKTFFYIWLFFHAFIFAGFAFMFGTKKAIVIDSDLFNMLPKPVMGKALEAADERLMEAYTCKKNMDEFRKKQMNLYNKNSK